MPSKPRVPAIKLTLPKKPLRSIKGGKGGKASSLPLPPRLRAEQQRRQQQQKRIEELAEQMRVCFVPVGEMMVELGKATANRLILRITGTRLADRFLARADAMQASDEEASDEEAISRLRWCASIIDPAQIYALSGEDLQRFNL